jgi:hypothetical protein
MSVWYVIPSKRPSGECGKLLQAWKDMGYKLMLHADSTAEANGKSPYADQFSIGPYLGYPRTVNGLIRAVMRQDPTAQWFVTGGDDIWPDPTHRAEEIALDCDEHFGGTFGVMQPTGDRWGEANNDSGKGGALIDHVAGSPWLGREFCRRMNGGQGPFWPEYFHMFDDAELQAVATRLGVFWQRRDLIHFHDHWGRPREGEQMGRADRMPNFLKQANSAENWNRSKSLFESRQAAGWPGSEPIA